MNINKQHEYRLRRYAIGLSGIAVITAMVAIVLVTIPTSEPTPSSNDSQTPVSTSLPPLFITSMTHMEGNSKDDVDEDLFHRHIDQLTWAMDLFDEYGAKITVESEASFAKANTNWGRNFLREVVDRGHGVGTHADFGAERVPKDVVFYTRAFKANKQLIDELVGPENNKGISGGIGGYDWVIAMSRAGFSYADGVVGFAYLSMPESARPDGWTDEYIRTTTYHDPAPMELADRVTISDYRDARDFIPDENGVLTLSSGDIGELASLAEGRTTCTPNCELTNEDVDVFIDAMISADGIRNDTGMATKVNVHIPMTLWDERHEDVLRYFLKETRSLTQDRDNVHWVTQLGAYEGYRDWQTQ